MASPGPASGGAARTAIMVLAIAFALGILGYAGFYAYKHYVPRKAKPEVAAQPGLPPQSAPSAAAVEAPVPVPSVPPDSPAATPGETTPPAPPSSPAPAPAATRPSAAPVHPRVPAAPSPPAPSLAPASRPEATPAPASNPPLAEPASPPQQAAPEPARPAPPPPETPPAAQPENIRPQPPVRPAPAPPAPAAPARAAYNGPLSGVLVWTGPLDKEGIVTINGGIASAGTLQGVLPGVPISVEIDARDIGMTETPRASNGWKKLTLRSHKKRNGPITIRWKVLNLN